jgi:hypothetical protein
MKFIGRCGSSADYNTMAEAMGLNAEQRRYMAQTLAPGMFVGQFGEGNWRQPFLFRVPPVDLAKHPQQVSGPVDPVAGLLPQADRTGGSSQADEPGGIGTLLALPTEVANEFVNWSPDGVPNRAQSVAKTVAAPASTLSETEARFVSAVIANPGQPSSSYAKIAGIGTHQAIAIRKELLARGFLKEHRVNLSNRGRASIVLEPTAAAMVAAANQPEGKI